MGRGQAIAIGLLAGLLLLAAPAEAQITFRAASSSAISFVAAGTQTTGTGSSIQPGIPAGTQAGDFAVLMVVGRPSDTSNPSAPSGWTLRSSSLRQVGTNDLKIVTYYRVLAGGDSNPTVNLPNNWQAGGMSAQIAVWRSVDATTPFDVADVTSSSGAADQWAPTGITPATAGALVVSAVGTSDANALAIVTAQGFTARMSGDAYDTTTGSNMSVGVADEFQGTAAAVTMPTWDQTTNGTDAWVGISFALRPAATGVTITKPTGTTTNDVMIAAIAVRPQTLTITMPSGWTLVRRMDNAAVNQNSLAVYRKVAGASEPALYTWTLSGGTPTGAAGGIQTFVGVDTTTPIDVENGQSSAITDHSLFGNWRVVVYLDTNQTPIASGAFALNP